MSRRMGMVCAVTVLAVASCLPSSFLLGPADANRPRQVVDGSYPMVAARLEDGLYDAGITVLSKSHAQEVRLAGQTKSGVVFCLHVKPEKTAEGEKTAVTMQWDREPDEDFWQLVVKLLTADAPATDESP